jgi:hypothetical protein
MVFIFILCPLATRLMFRCCIARTSVSQHLSERKCIAYKAISPLLVPVTIWYDGGRDADLVSGLETCTIDVVFIIINVIVIVILVVAILILNFFIIVIITVTITFTDNVIYGVFSQELEMMEQRGQSLKSKAETQAKYGWS